MITTVLFDLDGTLLPMDQDVFTKGYFKLLAKKAAPRGYAPEELVSAIWKGTAAMVNNNGGESNQEAFIKSFAETYGKKAYEDMELFEEFYSTDFNSASIFCGYNEKAAKTVRAVKELGFRTALATNPIFPAKATEIRIKWTGLSPDDFEFYTSYENIGYCKPNPKYFEAVANRMGVSPTECLMVGNDVSEDMVAETIGMTVFLLTDCMINKEDKDINAYPHGGFEELMEFIRYKLRSDS